MKIKYLLTIENPTSRMAEIRIKAQRSAGEDKLKVFLPSWCPGSYTMREYGRLVKNFRVFIPNGDWVYFEQIDKGTWEIDFSVENQKDLDFEIQYSVLCSELTCRTSHIDSTHAFIHGSSVFMGIVGREQNEIELEVKFPALWSKISTGLEDISPKREIFLYGAKNYDEFIDCPLEIGCHETDGFRAKGIDHEIAIYGPMIDYLEIKKDIKTIVESILSEMGPAPFKKYLFIFHLVPGVYGGLEHLNSTAIQWNPLKISSRENYLKFLTVISHEYLHAWNGKRIRPQLLGPFDYLKEAQTRLLWLVEGLTSFLDSYFLLKCNLMELEEYLDLMKDKLVRYESCMGKRFQTLEDSSFNAWNVFYKPDENSNNYSVSYYLKGSLAFHYLQMSMAKDGKKILDFFKKLWEFYLKRPSQGLTYDEIISKFKEATSAKFTDKLIELVSTTVDIDFVTVLKSVGLDVEYEESNELFWGAVFKNQGERIKVKSVVLDGPSFKSGLCAGDEIIAINGIRVLFPWISLSVKELKQDKNYILTINRNGRMIDMDFSLGKRPTLIKKITCSDQEKSKSFLI